MNRDCLVVGFFMGFLVSCLMLCVVEAYYQKPRACEVSVSMGKETHVRYGIVIGDM